MSDEDIVLFDRADNDRIMRYVNKHSAAKFYQHHDDVMIELVEDGLYSEDVFHVRPGFIDEALTPKPDRELEWGGMPVSLVGEVSLSIESPMPQILAKAGLQSMVHPDLPDFRFCGYWNCPRCEPIRYSLERWLEQTRQERVPQRYGFLSKPFG